MTDFLLELRSEEIPARMQDKAREDLARLFTAELDKAGLKAAEIVTFATPRRLALIAKGLPLETEAVSEERKGPRADAPEQAIEGFKRNLPDSAKIVSREDAKGAKVLFAIIKKPGLPTDAVLMNAIREVIRSFPWPKSQRWGAASVSMDAIRWVRPLQGIVALFGERPIICGYEGIESSQTTLGHRFHSDGAVLVQSPNHYVEALRAAHVIVDQEERRAIIRAGAEKAAADAGLTLVPDEGLVNENSGLTEWPVPMLGRFDPAFLEVPEEVIQLTARVNQKYFVCHDKSGKLANAFVCTANIVANDGGAAIVAGNEKVLAARLSDAKFFWEQDLKIPLDEQAKKLSQITFHEKLGTVADKVERVAKLARWLVEEGIIKGASADDAERAARLCKADLVTGMVGEFPELQGVMGGYYARAQGEADAVADAVRDHYKPVGQGDDVPTAPVTVAVSLADKLDTLACFFANDEKPTGSKDPYALRRAALGVLQLILDNRIRVSIRLALATATYHWYLQARKSERRKEFAEVFYGLEQTLGRAPTLAEIIPFADARLLDKPDEQVAPAVKAGHDLITFFADRLKVQQREAGVRHDLIDAVFALGGEDDLVRLLARVRALQGFVGTDEGANLLAGYKRAANILKQGGTRVTITAPDLGIDADSEDQREASLVDALNKAEPKAALAIAADEFEEAMKALATLREPIDSFFEGVLVFHPNVEIATRRLDLLRRFRAAVHQVADFSRIEG